MSMYCAVLHTAQYMLIQTWHLESVNHTVLHNFHGSFWVKRQIYNWIELIQIFWKIWAFISLCYQSLFSGCHKFSISFGNRTGDLSQPECLKQHPVQALADLLQREPRGWFKPTPAYNVQCIGSMTMQNDWNAYKIILSQHTYIFASSEVEFFPTLNCIFILAMQIFGDFRYFCMHKQLIFWFKMLFLKSPFNHQESPN